MTAELTTPVNRLSASCSMPKHTSRHYSVTKDLAVSSTLTDRDLLSQVAMLYIINPHSPGLMMYFFITAFLNCTLVFGLEVWFSASLLFQPFYTKPARSKILRRLVVEIWRCSQGYVTTLLIQMFPAVKLFSCFSTSMINLAICDDANIIWQRSKCNGN